jgi:shikimate kinase
MHLILFGFKSCGKTYFGKLIAKKLNRLFIDTDDLVIQAYQQQTNSLYTIRQIYEILKETDFRKLEATSLSAIKLSSPSVIALGGGTLLNHQSVSFFQALGHLVYLKTPFDTLRERILQKDLPSFIDSKNPVESLYEIYQKRTAIYELIPAQRIEMDATHEDDLMEKFSSIMRENGI